MCVCFPRVSKGGRERERRGRQTNKRDVGWKVLGEKKKNKGAV